MNQAVKEEKCSSSEDGEGTSSNHAPSIPFHDVYSILSDYREQNGGLDIPRTDEAMTRLVPALNKIGFTQVPLQHVADEANDEQNQQGGSKSVDDSVHDDKQPGAGSGVERSRSSSTATAAASIKKEALLQDTPPVPTAAANASKAAHATKLEGRCDICEQLDGFRDGYNLQRCSVCSLTVHERCYGMALTTTKNKNFVCKACAAIDTTVEVNNPSILGTSSRTKATMKVQKRPTECVLCNVHDGIHAMHPLFDTHGPEGRQLVISSGKADRKLAWVHTLCANYICAKTGGSVYGCYGDDGRYEDDSDEEYTDEENEVRFYAMATKENGEETAWSKIIADCREKLMCSICGKRDNSGNSLRIALQCCANDANEPVDFKRRHGSDRSECFVGMHVGCARWKVDPPIVYGRECRQCYFCDGVDDGKHDDPQLACYCRKHAEDIIANNKNYRQGYNSPNRQTKKVAKKTSPVAARKRQSVSKSESFKRGVTMIRKKDKGGKVEKKRKFGAPDESQAKRPRVDDDGSQEAQHTVFRVQGRSSKILSQSIPTGLKRSMELEGDNQRQNKRFKSEEH